MRNGVPLTSFSQPLSPTETGESKWGSAIEDMNDNMKGKKGIRAGWAIGNPYLYKENHERPKEMRRNFA